jgi:hypothetical protein
MVRRNVGSRCRAEERWFFFLDPSLAQIVPKVGQMTSKI